MKKKYLQFLGLGLGLLISGVACAGMTVAKIESILVFEEGDLIYVYPQGGVAGAPACHGTNGNYLSFSMKRPRAKEYYAGLLMAFSTGKTVMFFGADACKDQPISETLMYFMIQGG